MGFSVKVAEQALVSCGRACSLCHKYCGMKMELHHIRQVSEGGEDSFDNCIPLCFNCHADVKAYNPRHPKGKSFSETELKSHRDAWYKKVKSSGSVETNVTYKNVDRLTYDKLLELLPMEGAISYFRDHHFSNAFHRDRLTDFYKFLQYVDRPDFEFMDSDLESIKAQLIYAINEFLNYMAHNTDPRDGNLDLQQVPRAWSAEDRSRFFEATEKLNNYMTNITSLYDSLVRTYRKKMLHDD